MKISDALQNFFKSRAANNATDSTIRYYEDVFRSFKSWLEKHNIDDTDYLDQDTVYDYLGYVSQTYAPATIKGRYIAIKMFFKFLHQQKITDYNYTDGIKIPKPYKSIYYFTKEEVIEILNTYDKDDFIGLRNYTIMAVLLGTGIRKAELIGLNVLDIEGEFIRVIGKGHRGGKMRLVPIGKSVRVALKRYVSKRNEYLAEKHVELRELFINKDGGPLGVSGVTEIFKQLRKSKAKWSTRVSAHTCRHTFAKLFLLNGGNLFALQDILGHEDIATTRIYVDNNQRELSFQHAKYNPLDNMTWRYM